MLLFFLACADAPQLLIEAPPELLPVFEDFVLFLDDPRVHLQENGKHLPNDTLSISLVADQDCKECYRIEQDNNHYIVHGGQPLGLQYGLADTLEALGYRFWHPYDPFCPPEIKAAPFETALQAPKVARRGIHLHTLHPIEALQAFYMADDSTEARRVMDWVIKNRGNHVQWVALNDISQSGSTATAWQARSKALITQAHQRGLTVGLGIQLFGSSNLQQAFDLVDSPGSNEEAQIRSRLETITKDLPWDVLNLSFGEFSGQDPDTFLASANLAYGLMQEALPGVEVPATIHVGNSEDLRVTYQGKEQLYYFLIQYAPGYLPWIHTVMYYNLFEDAGGAYGHQEFDEHRAFLLEHLQAKQPVGYFPESAYWVAFDNSVPLYLPLYVYSRWNDLKQIQAAAPDALADHVEFSSGWEWGYWQNDVASLRMAWGEYPDYSDFFKDMYAPLGTAGTQISTQLSALTELQHHCLMEERLAPYMAGRDAFIDIGETQGIIAQPDRPSYEEILAFNADERANFVSSVIQPLNDCTTQTTALQSALPRETEGSLVANRALKEVQDGISIDALRGDFASLLLQAVVAKAEGQDPAPLLAQATDRMTLARLVVGRRGGDLHDPQGNRWLAETWENPTIYDAGYLAHAESLCFWDRELSQARNLLLGEDTAIPACAL